MLQSIRAKLQLMLLLLSIIILLTFLNFFMNQTVVKLEHDYAEVIAVNNHFADNIARELSSLGNPEEFSNLKNSYIKLYLSCLNCHDSNPGGILLIRNEILEKLHTNQLAGIQLRQTVNDRLNELTRSVRYIHEHHIATLKNFLKHNQLREEPYPTDTVQKENSAKSALELDIIPQTVAIQHSLADIIRNFYVLKDTHAPFRLQNEFLNNISLFYTAVNTFESYSLDAQDGLVVEELLDSGRTFENSFSELVQLEERERKLFLQLYDNQRKTLNIVSEVTGKVKNNRDRLHNQLIVVQYSSFLFISFLILMIVRQGKAIICSINRLVTETDKIKKDYNYRISENPYSEEEFRILSKALNSMAENLNERIIKLNEETRLRIRAEKEKTETEIRLQQAKQMVAIGTLAGGIAHDFNNLLTAILGNINLATYSLTPDHEIYNNLVQAEKASKRAHKLTNQLLTFSKGGAPIKETAPIHEVIRESAFFVLHGSNVDCSIDIPANLWLAKIDKGQIGQVIQNLTLNADHSMPKGGTISITCRNHIEKQNSPTLKKGCYVQVDVQDQGKGIKKENISHIFDPYFTTKEKGSIKGSGLGLAIVQSIISRHGGYITVNSQEEIGTTFTFFLPAVDERNRPQQQTSGDILSGEGRILVMDDESMILAMMTQSLPSLGYEVETADSGEQTLKMYDKAAKNKTPFTLVIMDLTIPGGMGARKTAEKILENYPDALLLVSSGYADDPIMINPSKYGFKAALQKPYELRELSQILHNLLYS
jgi:signal transduction histidine kinase/CheY-like chemotaxis protein